MYRRPKFLEILIEIRQDMAHEADYDVDLFAEIARSGKRPANVELRTFVVDDAHSANGDVKIQQLPLVQKPVIK